MLKIYSYYEVATKKKYLNSLKFSKKYNLIRYKEENTMTQQNLAQKVWEKTKYFGKIEELIPSYNFETKIDETSYFVSGSKNRSVLVLKATKGEKKFTAQEDLKEGEIKYYAENLENNQTYIPETNKDIEKADQIYEFHLKTLLEKGFPKVSGFAYNLF